MRYFVPQEVVSSFISHAVNNFTSKTSKHHVETLAYLFGRKVEDDITVLDIIYPEQHGTPGHVDDLGKHVTIHTFLAFSLLYLLTFYIE